MNSLYADYMRERRGAELIEKDFGFVFYKLYENAVFIVDMHVAKEFRKTGKSKVLAGELEKIALEKGLEFITAEIYLADPGHDQTLAAALLQGFSVIRSDIGVLTIAKKIGGANG